MFNKSKDTSQIDTAMLTQTVIAEGITIKDNSICGTGSVSVGGVFFGEIDIDGFLIITESGNVRGTVRASSAHVYGTLEGNAVTSGTTRIFSGGKIYGDVSCGSFVVDEGAGFGGQCNMGGDEITIRRLQRQERHEIEALPAPVPSAPIPVAN